MSTARSKALGKEGTYSFKTKNGWRVDAKGKSPHEAYPIARSITKHHQKHNAMFNKSGGDERGKKAENVRLSGSYFKYDKNGIHDNYKSSSSYRPAHFKKGENH
jgi:hypothetical protein